MRTIKFRGKIKNDPSYRPTNFGKGVWVVGLMGKRPCIDKIYANKFYINTGENEFEVDPETIGQFTGMKDCNGEEIYEGDVVQHKDGRYFTVIFDDFSFLFNNGCISYHLEARDGLDVEVIGNIHDKKDLMQENNKQN